MERFDPAQVQAYLDAHYLTLEELAARGGASPARVLELIDALCVPPHSHEVRGVTVFASTFGEYTAAAAPRRYYHPSVADWVRKASALARTHSLAEVARLLREEFARAKIASLVKPDPDHVLSPGERRELAAAIKQYNRVALDFGAHEFADSSRHRKSMPRSRSTG